MKRLLALLIVCGLGLAGCGPATTSSKKVDATPPPAKADTPAPKEEKKPEEKKEEKKEDKKN